MHTSGRHVDTWSLAVDIKKKNENVIEEYERSAVGQTPPEVTQCLLNPTVFKNVQVSILLLSMTLMSVVSAFP